jgi:hypothetical protein
MKHLLAVSTVCLALLFCGSAIPCHATTIDFSNYCPSQSPPCPTGTSDISLGAPVTVPGTDIVLYLTTTFNELIVSGDPNIDGGATVYYTGLSLTETYCDPNSTQCGGLATQGLVNDNIYVTGSSINTSAGCTAPPPAACVAAPNSALSVSIGTGFSSPLVDVALAGAPTGTGLLTGVATGTNSAGTLSVTPPTGTTTFANSLLTALGLTGQTLSLQTSGPMLLTDQNSGANGSYTNILAANLDLTTGVTGVPEPGSWLMMALGISLMAFAVRKRTARVKA